jgi:Big-like domain-containing protein
MIMQWVARSVSLAGVGVVIGVAACGGDLTLPDTSGQGFDLSVVAGNGQTGTVGEPLPDPLVVELRGSAGQLVAGRRVAFLPQSPGDFTPDTATTDAQGLARARWILGPSAGSCSALVRLVTSADSSAPAVPVAAAAVAGQPDSIRAISGTVQAGRREQTLPDPLVVVVVDRFGNPVSGVEVGWKVTQGGGEVTARSTRTAVDGQTGVNWTLGDKSSVQQVSARVDGLSGSPVIFTATVLF